MECVVSKTSGIFSCVAENEFGEEEVETQIIVRKYYSFLQTWPSSLKYTSKSSERRKTSVATVEAPTFALPLQDQGIVDGHPATLTCKVISVSPLSSTDDFFRSEEFPNLS